MRSGGHQVLTIMPHYGPACAQEEDCGPPPLVDSDAEDCPAPDERGATAALAGGTVALPPDGAERLGTSARTHDVGEQVRAG